MGSSLLLPPPFLLGMVLLELVGSVELLGQCPWAMGWHGHCFFFQLSEELGQISRHRFINSLLEHPPHLSNSLMPFHNHTVTRCHFSHGYNNINSKYIQFDMFDIYLIKYDYRYCTNIINSFDMIDIRINIFLFVSFPF